MNIDALYPYVLPHVLGCPSPVMEHHIRLAAIEFCNKTRWHEDECIAVNIGTGSVLLQPDSHLEVANISKVYVDGREFGNKTRQSGLGLLNAGSLEQFYCVVGDGELAVNPTPAADVAVRVVATYRPTMAALVLDDALTEWRDGIASGAVHRIAALPKQAFSDAGISMFHKDLFDDAVKKAKVKKYLGSTETAPRRMADVF